MKDYLVCRITYDEARPWVMLKHYAKRMPSITKAFALYENKTIVGVCCFGNPACQANSKLGEFKAIELLRVVVETKNKNAASMLISKSLKLLDKPIVVVSYADKGINHVGYIYQATNWFYTGISKGDVEYIINDKHYHRKGAFDKYGTGSKIKLKNIDPNIKILKQSDKHRYFYCIGSKKHKKEMLIELKTKYPILPYPKGETKRYDASAKLPISIKSFPL